jgi:hypothetical protein
MSPSQRSHLSGEPFPDPLHGRLAGFDQQLAVAIPAYMHPEELKTFFEPDGSCLGFVEGQNPGY